MQQADGLLWQGQAEALLRQELGSSTELRQCLYLSFDGAKDTVSELLETFGPKYSVRADAPVFSVLCSYRRLGVCDYELSAGQASELIFQLLGALADAGAACRLRTRKRTLVDEARSLVGKRIEDRLQIGDLANELFLSREHLSRLFSREMGMTLTEYIQREKIRRACDLLRVTYLTTREISVRCGYVSPASFTRTFKKLVGISPKEYRRRGAAIKHHF